MVQAHSLQKASLPATALEDLSPLTSSSICSLLYSLGADRTEVTWIINYLVNYLAYRLEKKDDRMLSD